MPPNTFRKLADKHVLVIGGSSGIGFSVAEGALAEGAPVTIASSSQARVDAAVARLQALYGADAAVQGFVCDLSEGAHTEARIEALFESATTTAAAGASGGRHGPVVHHVVLTAASGIATPALADVTVDGVLETAQMRLLAPLLLAKVCQRRLPKSNASSLTFTSGFAATVPPPNWPVLCFMLGGMSALTRSLAADMAPVRVNLVQPGATKTELWRFLSPEQLQQFAAEEAKVLPTGAMGAPEDVAEAYLWLMKDNNATGAEANSNGGALLKR